MPRLISAALLFAVLPFPVLAAPADRAAPAKSPPADRAAPAKAAAGSAGVLPLDAVLAIVEDQIITASQVTQRLALMRALAQGVAADPKRPLTQGQAYQELLEARLLSWDAQRKRIEVTDAEVDRLLDLVAQRLSSAGGKQALSAELARAGVDEASYREMYRQELLFAKLERADSPPRPRQDRLRDLEAEAQVQRTDGLLSLTAASARACVPNHAGARPAVGSAGSPASAVVQGICIEGERTAQKDAWLAALAPLVPVGTALDHAAVSRAQARLLAQDDGIEAAAAYAVSTQPNEAAERAQSLWVVFRVQPRPRLASVEFVGLPSGFQIEPQAVSPTERVSHRVLRSQTEHVRDSLRDACYRSVRVQPQRLPQARDAGGTPVERLRLTVAAGLCTRIEQVELIGVGDARRAQLLPLLPFQVGGAYQEVETLEARFRLELHYRDLGYLRASVAVPDVQAGAPGPGGSPRVRLRYTISEGPQAQLNSLKLAGSLPLPEAQLRRLMTSQLRQPVSVAALRSDIQKMQDAARAAGKPVNILPNVELRNEGALVDVTLEFAAESTAPTGGDAKIPRSTTP